MSEVFYLSVGGNLGDVPGHFAFAMQALKKAGACDLEISPIYQTEPVGCPPDTPDFLNAVIRGAWPYSAEELLRTCQAIEVQCGRPADHPHWVSRTLDLDILFFGLQKIQTPPLTIPHPLIRQREFVLRPLSHFLEKTSPLFEI